MLIAKALREYILKGAQRHGRGGILGQAAMKREKLCSHALLLPTHLQRSASMRVKTKIISFPVIRKEDWERALNQAQQDHESNQSIQQDVHGENQHTFEHVKVKVHLKPYEPSKEERQSHKATHCPFRAWCEICVKAKSPESTPNKWGIGSTFL